MKVLSIQTGPIKTYSWEGKQVESAIFKDQVDHPVFLTKLGLEGDRQAEVKYHGGYDKAVYSYASEYRELFSQETEGELSGGCFGENISTQGLLDSEVNPGDIFKVGDSIIQAMQPRIPCFKIGMRFNNQAMTMLFTKACKYGIYYKVLQEGTIQKGDTIQLIEKSSVPFTIEDIAIAYAYPKDNLGMLDRILSIDTLDEDLRKTLTSFFNRYSKN